MIKNKEKITDNTEDSHSHESEDSCCRHDEENNIREIIELIAGALIFCAGLVFTYIFNINQYLLLAVFILSYVILGGGIVLNAVKNIAGGKIFDENFLMGIATTGAFIIGEYPEAAAVMLFFRVGEYFQGLAVNKSKKSIAALMDIRPDYANLLTNGKVIKVSPDTIRPGEIIIVKPGEKIPLDGVVTEGESMLDTSALTGEPVPRKVKVSDTVLSGCINKNGVLTIQVNKTFGESAVAKIIELTQNAAAKKAPTEKFITKFARHYTPAVVGLAALICVVSPLFFDGLWSEWIRRGLVFLVISCPCALVISIPLSFFGGIGGASKKGVLVKGGNYLEALNNLDTVVFDKTGTLTKGVFEVTEINPVNGFTKNELLGFAASAEAFSNHPIAASILKAYGVNISKNSLSNYNETAGYGVSVKAKDKFIAAGNYGFMLKTGAARLTELNKLKEEKTPGTRVYVSVNNIFAGHITISDEIKPDSRKAIESLKAGGVRRTVMLTGDNPEAAGAVAADLNIDEFYAGLLPEQKVEIFEKIKKDARRKNQKAKTAFVGDGINDAPVLARADIGVAMGGLGSDAAIEAADIVLMTDEVSKLAGAIGVARLTRRIVWQNIIFALAVKIIFLSLGALGMASMWEAVFADAGAALIAVLNASRVSRGRN